MECGIRANARQALIGVCAGAVDNGAKKYIFGKAAFPGAFIPINGLIIVIVLFI
jgi:hypothetical protein